MSLSLERQLLQDRALRDAARELVKADVSHVRSDLTAQGLASRFATRMSEGASDLYDEAVETAQNNRGVLMTLIAAVALWFARNPIMSLLDENENDGENGEEHEEPGGHSTNTMEN